MTELHTHSPGEPSGLEQQSIDSQVSAIERPASNLLLYYALSSLLLGPLFPVILIPLLFRYKSLRYRFDDEGVSMRWGVIFRKEISLTYARIQDIHLASNAVERHLGLACVLVQTASGSAGAEMTIEGVHEFEAVRDFLYQRMRGAKGLTSPSSPSVARRGATAQGTPAGSGLEGGAELASALREVTQELRALKESLARQSGRD